ncbi:MAG: menaquinone biosynthetic enzyme MqnA/MqnD family protein [Pyrinomonadaceae bacterium]
MTTKVPRISASSYSNTAPLIWSFLYGSKHGKYELILDNAPARSAELLAQKRVDCALVPVIEYQRIGDVLLVPDVCVGAKERVRSVCLVTKGEDLKDVKTVSLDASSKTSVVLTKIIFREFLSSEPSYQTAKPNLSKMLAESDCALLIGDPALTIDETKYSKFDLAETWKSLTGFGFVFAMWMAREDSVEIARNIDFAGVRDEGLAHLDEIIANYETGISLSREEFKEYLSKNISFSIDENMQKGLSLYFELADRHHLIEKNKPMKFLSL